MTLSGRLPQDAILLMCMSIRIRSTDERLLPQTGTLCRPFFCWKGEENQEPASRLPACGDGYAIVSKDYKSKKQDESTLSAGTGQQQVAPTQQAAPRGPLFSHSRRFIGKREHGTEPSSLCLLHWCRRGTRPIRLRRSRLRPPGRLARLPRSRTSRFSSLSARRRSRVRVPAEQQSKQKRRPVSLSA